MDSFCPSTDEKGSAGAGATPVGAWSSGRSVSASHRNSSPPNALRGSEKPTRRHRQPAAPKPQAVALKSGARARAASRRGAHPVAKEVDPRNVATDVT